MAKTRSAPQSAAPKVPLNPEADAVNAKATQSRLFATIWNELNVNQDQQQKRQVLIKRIEAELTSRYGAENRMVSYVIRFGHPRAMIHTSDIAPLDTILRAVVHGQEINVLLHGPGGDGSIVEKMVEMCRGHLPRKNGKLRVIVPNLAKSAATVFALGADEIVMGYCSELGPIDPQVTIVNSGVPTQLSAVSYVEARENLMADLAKATAKGEPTTGYLTQLAGLNIPFIQEMANVIHFAESTAARLLNKYNLVTKFPKAAEREKKSKEIANKLLSKELFPIHGHFINAEAANNDLELNVAALDRTDALWEMIWEYYIRAEVQMLIPPAPDQIRTKLFESERKSITTSESATR